MLKDVDDVREFNGNPFLKPKTPPQSRLFKLALSFKLIQSRQDSFLDFFKFFFAVKCNGTQTLGLMAAFVLPVL